MLDVLIDTDAALADLNWRQREQLPFAMALSANNVSKEAQAAVRTSLGLHFTIAPDRRAFLERTIRFERKNYATKTNLAAKMGINASEAGLSSKDRSYVLGRHEVGGSREASDPMHPFFLPSQDLRAGAFDVPPRSLYPRSLGIYERRTASGIQPGRSRVTSRGKVQRIGKRRTFVIDARATSDPRAWGIWQRFGPGKDDIRLLWAFRTHITLKPRLHFYETVQRTIDERWASVFDAALARAVRTAR